VNGTNGMVIRTPAGDLPLIASPEQLGGLVVGKTGRAVRGDCESGAIETLPRAGGEGAHWRIPVAKYLDNVGVPYEIVPGPEPVAC
jgi:hypothetical protein